MARCLRESGWVFRLSVLHPLPYVLRLIRRRRILKRSCTSGVLVQNMAQYVTFSGPTSWLAVGSNCPEHINGHKGATTDARRLRGSSSQLQAETEAPPHTPAACVAHQPRCWVVTPLFPFCFRFFVFAQPVYIASPPLYFPLSPP